MYQMEQAKNPKIRLQDQSEMAGQEKAAVIQSLYANPELLKQVMESINRPEKEIASPVSQRESRFHVTQK